MTVFQGDWKAYGRWPPAQIAGQKAPAPELAGIVAATAVPTAEAPWHDPDKFASTRLT